MVEAKIIQRLYWGPLWVVYGLVNFAPAVAYHFCLNLPATLSQPRTSYKGFEVILNLKLGTSLLLMLSLSCKSSQRGMKATQCRAGEQGSHGQEVKDQSRIGKEVAVSSREGGRREDTYMTSAEGRRMARSV